MHEKLAHDLLKQTQEQRHNSVNVTIQNGTIWEMAWWEINCACDIGIASNRGNVVISL